MDSDLIHDRGRGPELVGSRITVYNLFPDLLDPAVTERSLCDLYQLTAEQVAAVRSYILRNYADVVAGHLRIEDRIRQGVEAQNAPEFRAKVGASRADFGRFKEWVAERKALGLPALRESGDWAPAFREWMGRRAAGAAV